MKNAKMNHSPAPHSLSLYRSPPPITVSGGSTVSVEDSNFTNCRAHNGNDGGAMWVGTSTVDVGAGVNFALCTATNGGAIKLDAYSEATVAVGSQNFTIKPRSFAHTNYFKCESKISNNCTTV